MRILELFSGTGNFSKIARSRGHETITIDKFEKADLNIDILDYDLGRLNALGEYDVIWMSPPCTTFSMASGNTHWTADQSPKTPQAIEAQRLIEKCKEIAVYCNINNKIFFIENPRARARWFLSEADRHTITYCQYGENRMKPTDIWTNCRSWIPRPVCKNGSPCHEAAPRGSKTGTQGLKGAKIRGRLPDELCIEIINACEKELQMRSLGGK